MALLTKIGPDELMSEYGGGQFPEIAGTYSGNLVVCADAQCVWDDLERYGCRDGTGRGRVSKEGHDFMVVNKLGETFPGRIEHWYSNEWAVLEKFVAARRNEYRREFDAPQHTHSRSGAKWNWPWTGHGSSGLGAILVGLWLGYEKIVVCGMPLDDGPHNGEPPWRGCRFESSEVSDTVSGNPDHHWQKAIKYFDGRVKSMSGRTQKWLGSP